MFMKPIILNYYKTFIYVKKCFDKFANISKAPNEKFTIETAYTVYWDTLLTIG
jgi:hypothetical protein